MGWTPDCKYPVVYAERGRGVYQIKTDLDHQKEFNDFVNEYILSSDEHANKLGLNIQDEEFGIMQLRNQRLVDEEGKLVFEFSLSYPAIITNEEICRQIQSKMSPCLELVCTSNYDQVRFEKDCFLCQTLKEIYEKITGLDGTLVTTTGGTMLRSCLTSCLLALAFLDRKESVITRMNGWMDRDDLITNAKIYALSILRVANGQ